MSYEVRCLADKRWLTESVFRTEAEAMAFARAKLRTGRVEAIRVVEETPGGRERLVFEQMGTVRDKKGVGSVPDDAVSLCDTVMDVYTPQARRLIGKVLRNYLNDSGICALELLSDPDQLKQLIRHEDLLNQAVNVVGGAQARLFGGKPQERIAALFALLGEIHTMATAAAADIGTISDAVQSGNVAALGAHLDGPMEPARKRILSLCAIGRCLSREPEAAGKIGILLDVTAQNPDHRGLRLLCDEVIADILDDQGAMRQMLGRRADLADATKIVMQIATGKRAKLPGDDPILARLSESFATDGFPQARQSLLAWLDQAIRSTQPLTREGAAADRAAFAALVSGMEKHDGLLGGPVMSEAVLMRARSVLFAAEEEQRVELALARMMRLLETPGSQLGFLLDLLEAPGTSKMAPAIARQLVMILREVSDLTILTDLPQEEAESLLASLRDRVAASALPDQVRDIVLPLFDRLRRSGGIPGSDPAEPQPDDPHRIALEFGQVLFRAGEKADCAFLVLSGRIGLTNVVNGSELAIATVGPGGVVGDTAVIGGMTRSTYAKAQLPTVLRRLDQGRFDQALLRLGEIEPDAHAVVLALRDRLRDLARRGMAV